MGCHPNHVRSQYQINTGIYVRQCAGSICATSTWLSHRKCEKAQEVYSKEDDRYVNRLSHRSQLRCTTSNDIHVSRWGFLGDGRGARHSIGIWYDGSFAGAAGGRIHARGHTIDNRQPALVVSPISGGCSRTSGDRVELGGTVD